MSRLKELRKDKGYSQLYVQTRTGIDQSDYSKIERGIRSPNIIQAYKLAYLYETSVDYIVGLTDEKKPYPKSENIDDENLIFY